MTLLGLIDVRRATRVWRDLHRARPSEPAYQEAKMVEIVLPTPKERPAFTDGEDEATQMEAVFGFSLAQRGLFKRTLQR